MEISALTPAKGEKEKISDSRDTWKVREKKLKFTYQEQKDYETIEEEIAELEDRLASVEEAYAKAATDFVKLNELTTEKESLEKELEIKLERFVYLSDLAERIEAQK